MNTSNTNVTVSDWINNIMENFNEKMIFLFLFLFNLKKEQYSWSKEGKNRILICSNYLVKIIAPKNTFKNDF